MAFSKSYREDFLLDFENYTFLNHGSYGAIPKVLAVIFQFFSINLEILQNHHL
jgi:hypothetical protein